MLQIVASYESQFDDPRQYEIARSFIEDFFVVLHNNKKFQSEILAVARIE